MKHYNEASWADFARNLLSADLRAAMQKHAGKCSTCRALLRMSEQIIAFAREEPSLTPPDNLVHLVKTQFMASAPAKGKVRLMFDSLLQPALAGVRGPASDRQLLFETDELYIDLRLESHRRAAPARVVGQLLSRAAEPRAAGGKTIRLHRGQALLASTTTNEFGEFQFDLAGSGLSLLIGSEDPIILPLAERVTPPGSPGQSIDLA
ncbi:MAG TPA: hypothetical protein VLV49_18065 [Terriglobales bacterium]|nr:hypothetical protein [Terriglobales bacterium]